MGAENSEEENKEVGEKPAAIVCFGGRDHRFLL